MTTGSKADSSWMPEARPGRVARPKPDKDQRGALGWVPGVHMIRHYQPAWLPRDLIAGVVLTAVVVPVGMAYAQACGLPPIVGLYASILPLLAYAIFGPSRILIVGPDAALTPMIATAILPLATGDVTRAMALAAALALLSGLLCIIVGVARLGFVTELLSKPIRYGYMNGIALMVLVSQLPRVFGFSAGGDNLPSRLLAIGEGVARGQTNWVALVIGAVTLVVVLYLKRWKRVPGVLIAVVGATLVVTLLDLAQRAGVPVVGPLPQGLPAPSLPLVRPEDLAPLVTAAVAIAAVSVAQTSVLSRAYAAKDGGYVDPNREMVGLGMANLAAGLFQGFPVNSAASRTPVAEDAGARSQLTGVTAALCVALLLIAAPNLLQNVPNAALGAVVIAAAIGLFEVQDLGRLYRMQRWEFWLSMGCFAGVVLFGAVPGILFAIALAVIDFLWEAWRPHHAVLGRVDGVKGYHDISRHPEAKRVPGLVLFRWDAPLFFANCEQFRSSVLDAVDESPTPVRWLVVTAEPVTSVDVTAADMLDTLHEELQAARIRMCFAAMKGPVKDKLKRFNLFDRFGEGYFFRTVGEAVNAYVRAEHVDWVDWEERGVSEVGRVRET
jgi:high affinity sulfate transporter 1